MTRKLFHLGLLAVVLVAGAASFAVRRTMGTTEGRPMDCTRQFLGLSGTQCRNIRSQDPDFLPEAQALSQSLQTDRLAMGNMLANAQASNDALKAQAQVVLDAHHALMRRTVRHLMVMRKFADVSQCARLNTLCSNVMQGAHGKGLGRGGQGRGMGMGMGMGRHMRRRGQGALAPALTLTDAQQETITQIDPNFEAEADELTQRVREAHLVFAMTLQDANSPDQSILQALEDFIVARTALEQHTIDHVLRIRPLLTSAQQQRLIGLCQGRR